MPLIRARLVARFDEVADRVRHGGVVGLEVSAFADGVVVLDVARGRGGGSVELQLQSTPLTDMSWRRPLEGARGALLLRAPTHLARSSQSVVRKAGVAGVIQTPTGRMRISQLLFAQDAVLAVDPFVCPPITPAASNLALALGANTIDTLTNLRVAVVGLGKTGSLAASTLARMGFAGLVLIDHDALESHNSMPCDLVDETFVGQLKSHVMAQAIRRVNPSLRVQALGADVASTGAVAALAQADIVVTCADSIAARRLVAAVGHRSGQLVLDVGLLVRAATDLEPSIADVRLIVPGSVCALCAGGFVSDPPDVGIRPSRRSLAQLSVHLGILQIEAWLRGHRSRTTWTRVSEGHGSVLTIESVAARSVAGCELCWPSSS